MKFLYFGDMHEQPGSPKNRTDNFRETLNNKVKEILSLGKKHNVRAFLQPGDFLNAKKYEYEFLSDVVKRWSTVDMTQLMMQMTSGALSPETVSERLKDWTPIVGAVGNHELHGESFSSYSKTSIAFLEQIGFMHFPTQDKPFIFTGEDGLTVAVTATSYDIGMDTPERVDDYIVKEKKGDIHIHIVHGYLTNRDMGDMFPHTVLDAIAKKTVADLTITGHDHMGFPLTTVDGKMFVNPGAPVRLKNDKKEMSRRPKVLLIEATKEDGLSVKSVYLKSAPVGKDILSREAIEEKNNLHAKMEEIKSIVQKANVSSGSSIKEVIAAIADNESLDEHIKTESVRLVGEKMDALHQETKVRDPYRIEKIVLENFQSHVMTELPVSAGLNVFVGTSGAGKSAIMRALAWVYENEGKNPRRFIHHQADSAKVSLYLSNGYVVSRVVEKKKSGKNGYEIYNPTTGQVEEHNTKSVGLVQDLLGFTSLDLDTEKSVPLNFQRQGEGWFFIGDGFTPSTRAKVIGAVYKTHFVDAVIKDLERDSKRLGVVKEEKETSLGKTKEKIAQFEHLADMKKNIDMIDDKMAQLAILKEKRDKLKEKNDTLCHLKEEINLKETIVSQLTYIEAVKERLKSLQEVHARRKELHHKSKQLAELHGAARQLKVRLASLGHLEDARVKFERLQSLYKARVDTQATLRTYDEKSTEMRRLTDRIQKLEVKVSDMGYQVVAEEKLNRLREMAGHRKLLADKVATLNELKKNGRALAANVEVAKKNVMNLQKQYETTLQEMGTCPVCQSQMTAQKINDIVNGQAV